MSYQYSYLLGDIVLLIIWVIFFLKLNNERKHLIKFSIILGFVGVIAEFVYVIDWWRPLTITNTLVGIEDFIYGFTIGGIAAGIYEEVSKRRHAIKINENANIQQKRKLSVFGLSLLTLFFISFLLLKNSFYASILTFVIPLIYIWFFKKYSIVNSVISGCLLVIISIPSFLIPEYITPGVIESTWYLKNWYGITIFKIPFVDIIWLFLAGALLGPLYELKKGSINSTSIRWT